MKRLAGKLAVLGAIATLAALVLGVAVAAAPSVDSASGVGKSADGGRFSFTAKGSPTDARGHVRYELDFSGAPWAHSRGTVECLYVSGNVAAMSGPFDDPGSTVLPYFLLVVIDHGAGFVDEAKVIVSPAPGHAGDADCGLASVEEFPPEIGAKVNARVTDAA